MKKDKIIIIILTIILIICCVGLGIIMSFDMEPKSEVGKLILECDTKKAVANKEVSCSLIGNVNDYEVSAVSANLKDNENYEIKEVKIPDIWEGDGEEGDIELYTDTNKKGKFDIVTFKVLLKDNIKNNVDIMVEDIVFFDKDFKEHKINNMVKTLKGGK